VLQQQKISFLNLPTPLAFLPRISKDLGIALYIKRDDLTDFGMGGNKLRKLEYYLHDAMAEGATMLLTVGGAQTNHGRLTASVAAKYGLKCAIVALDDYPGEVSSNLLLDRIMGAEVFMASPKPGVPYEEQLDQAVAMVREKFETAGEKVYFIPMGGSGVVGIPGYYNCAVELREQMRHLSLPSSRLIVAVGSMGTYMGLFAGIKNEYLEPDLTLEGIAIAPFYENPPLSASTYYRQVRDFHQMKYQASVSDFLIHGDYTFGGYNNPVKEIREAVYYMARKEGILLDPCYTGKAFYGLMDLVKKGEIRQGETVIFLHTGGQPGLNGPNHRRTMEEELQNGIHIL
jgi:D-cysteine desulfhydrase